MTNKTTRAGDKKLLLVIQTPTGLLTEINVPSGVTDRLYEGQPMPLWFMNNIKLTSYLISSDLSRDIQDKYGVTVAKKIHTRLVSFLDSLKTHQIEAIGKSKQNSLKMRF